ncbi:MAG TPA: sugar ABC transporter permease [Anaerolineales bacterium]|nr:sugar ABC transporter permease [Anaerolineales bacterium]
MEETMEVKKKWTDGFRFWSDREDLLGPLFLFPAVVYIIALVGIPFIIALAYSISDVTVGNTSLDIIGLRNFQAIIKTPQFIQSLSNTILFTIISQIIIIVLANILALILSSDFKGKWFARFLIMLPWATPIALGTIGWLWLLDSKFSPIDWTLRYLHLLGEPGALLGAQKNLFYLGRLELAKVSIIVIYIWRMLPLSAVILMAGLTSIPQDILDQADVDGASFWRTLFQIKLPLIIPIMSIALLFSLIFTVGDMAVVYVLTRGGPVYYTQILPTWAFYKGIESGALAEGAATALFLFPVLLAVAILVLRYSRRTEVT